MQKTPKKRLQKVAAVVGSWEEVLREFLFFKQAQHRVGPTTLSDYEGHVRRYFKRFPQSWQDPTSLSASVMEYMSDDVKPVTFNLRLGNLRGFFQYCVEKGFFDNNPLEGFKRRKADPRIVDVPEDTLQRLLDLPDQKTFVGLRDYTLILITLDTGIRPKEAFHLTVNDFDLRHLVVTVPAEVAKTRTARTLPILPLTAESLRKLIRARPDFWDNTDVPVFCTNEGTMLNRHTWGDRMEAYSKQLGVHIRPYDLRHSFALMYLRNGGHAFGLQRTMGHTDMNMTKRYVNLTGQDLAKAHQTASPLNSLVASPRKGKTRMGKLNGLK
ncbi:tyrosine-type recombinase/integrase [Tumebacillus permanentifrigoris]|uniref:Site-specific recombinase XerD n=1 Tax=Tumebacillus permanentifrigoris TaxID=378543 RepID=A0A316D4G5_9BACL|nr:site-specific integrase [Tumebacillus permanentifrigoris]PWK06583.1 site-specific recombinase XerD [Tumebacillus permanentifrigoris]